MTDAAKTVNISEIAKKKRYLHLVEKMSSGKTLTKSEIGELSEFEQHDQELSIVKSAEEAAPILGVADRTIYRWRREGMPTTSDGRYDIAKIREWIRERQERGDNDGKKYWEEKVSELRAKLLKIKIEILEGGLIPADKVEKDNIAKVVALKAALLSLPAKVATAIEMRDAAFIAEYLRGEINSIIDNFAEGEIVEDEAQTDGGKTDGSEILSQG